MIELRKKEGIGQRELSVKMGAVYHYVHKIEKDVKENKMEGKTVLMAARYADALGRIIRFKVSGMDEAT